MNLKQKYGKVAVLMGGDSPEREISLMSGNAVLKALQDSGVDAHAFDPLVEPLEKLKEYCYDRACIMMHGKNSEDGKLQGALEYLKIPYTGSGVLASSLAMDKYRTKLIWHTCGIPVAPDQMVLNRDYIGGKFQLNLDLPIIVKPNQDGSTIGFSRVTQLHQLKPALEKVFHNAPDALIEKMVIGDEYTITICDGEVYPIIKIEAPDGEYDYEHKYFSDDTKYLAGYQLGKLQSQIETWTKHGYEAIGASGFARIDFMIAHDGSVYFLEINTIPGMTAHSLVPQSVATVGMNFAQLCLKILDGAGLAK